MKINFSLKNILIFLSATCLTALSFAYISEYFFGLKPCILCLYQRIPFFFIMILCALCLVFVQNKKILKITIISSIIALFINSAIAFYHVGVEQKIFKMTEKCVDDFGSAHSVEELRKMVKNAKLVKCDEPQFFFLGLTMAFWNMIFCFGLGIFTVFLLRKSANPS